MGKFKSQITTKGGDDGTTGLLYGGRVDKAHNQIEACGVLDEAVSFLGLARSYLDDESLANIVLGIQKDLFALGAELATDTGLLEKLDTNFVRIDKSYREKVEKLSLEYESKITLAPNFVIPGASKVSAYLDVARVFVRRGERRVVKLMGEGLIKNGELVVYLNRTSDLLFNLARYVDKNLPPEIVTGLRK